ncbi:MAG: hypothetical protein V4850_35305 [Myxococcota bacterium]
MWIAFVPALLAAPPAPAPTEAPAEAKGAAAGAERAVALEAGLTLAIPFAPLGAAPGLRVLGEVALVPRFTLGGEAMVRLPGGAAGSLEDDALAEDLDWRTGLTVVAAGPRVAFAFGPLDGVHGRVALAGGVAWVAQDTFTSVGHTHDAVLTGWLSPQVGGLLPVGPGWLTVDLHGTIAPAPLLVLGPAPGGAAVGLSVGYRFGF